MQRMDESMAIDGSKRLESLDALRGLDMFFITGGSGVLIALGKLIYGSPDNWIAVQMEHVDWAGFHLLDLVFALFLFLAGASWPFSLASRRARGLADGRIALGILRRFAILFVLGAVMFGLLGFDFAHVRFNSILGRIGFGWAVAALGTLYLGRKWNWAFAVLAFGCGCAIVHLITGKKVFRTWMFFSAISLAVLSFY